MRRAGRSADTLRTAERWRAALQLERTLIVSLVCVFITMLLWTAMIVPLPRPEPLLTLPGALTFEKAPDRECQPVVSVQANGTLYLAERIVTPAELTAALHGPYAMPAGR